MRAYDRRHPLALTNPELMSLVSLGKEHVPADSPTRFARVPA